MLKKLIDEIDELQKTRLSSLERKAGQFNFEQGPPTKSNGLYWIYTDHTDMELIEAIPSPQRGSLNFRTLVERNALNSYSCKETTGGFRVVYSGIGGVGLKKSGGLRERILQEFRGGEGTGSLAIANSSLMDLSRWKVSFVLWNEIDSLNESYSYYPFATAIEGLWRLRFGWPLLCTK